LIEWVLNPTQYTRSWVVLGQAEISVGWVRLGLEKFGFDFNKVDRRTSQREVGRGAYREGPVVEDLVGGTTEEVRDAVILEDGVHRTLNVSPVPQRLRVAAVDAITTTVPPVLATYGHTGRCVNISSHLI